MNEQSHITTEEMADFTAQREGQAGHRVKEHVSGCSECAEHLASFQAFVEDLDTAWNRERLRTMDANHPSLDEIQAVWLDAPTVERGLESARAHIGGCETCQAHLERLEEGFKALMEMDPLSRPPWSDLIRGKFAVGIEMVVEAATGVYTSAAGMMRDVMTPQGRAHLAPTPAVAMGYGVYRSESVSWSDAAFVTDELSGEISGSTDPNTGRGIITMVVNKTGAYVALPPIVDLFNEEGETVGTQFALDTGDRYTMHFTDLDQGRYLIGIRQPGD